MTDYTPVALAQASKVAARFIQRTRWVMNLQREIEDHNQELQSIKTQVEAEAKDLAIAEFKFTQAKKEGDPRVDIMEKAFESATKIAKEQEKYAKEQTDENTKAIAECEEKIGKVMSGDLKVDANKREELAKELVQARVEASHTDGKFDKE